MKAERSRARARLYIHSSWVERRAAARRLGTAQRGAARIIEVNQVRRNLRLQQQSALSSPPGRPVDQSSPYSTLYSLISTDCKSGDWLAGNVTTTTCNRRRHNVLVGAALRVLTAIDVRLTHSHAYSLSNIHVFPLIESRDLVSILEILRCFALSQHSRT